MKKTYKRKNKIYKRILSFILVFALVFTGFPVDLLPADVISEGVMELAELVMNAKAEGELDALKTKYAGNTHTFTSGTPDLSEYSLCFQDSTWAASHANDTITLNPTAGNFVFDANYHPIGSSGAPFDGTIILNTTADDFVVATNVPIFDYVKDSATIRRINDNANIPLNIKRGLSEDDGDVGDSISPLLAKHVVGSSASSAESPYEWKITLSSANVRSYSGVIYEMTDEAKVNLTFSDKSNHTPQLDNNNNITSGSIIDNHESGTNYGILCGAVKGNSALQVMYTKTNDDNVTFIGTETGYCGGLVGELNNSTFELLAGSSALKVDFRTAKDQVGFICGHAEGSIITLPDGYAFSGAIDGKTYAGGIAGYCKNTVVNYATSEGAISLTNCDINNGDNASATGGVFGYYECETAANDILLNRTYSLSSCTIVSGKGYSGGIAGEYKPTYSSAVSIDLDKYTLGDSISLSGTTAGGLFGKFTANGNVTITDSNSSNTHFAPPASSASYGGVIGEYVNTAYANTLSLTGFTVNNLNCTSTGSVGGVICMLNGSTYVSVSGINVTNVTANDASYFGGIVSKLNNNNAGSFIDVSGDYTLSMASGKTYKGGAIAGSFKKGVIRLEGVTDISGAQAANGYAQLVYENDETLVYAKGSGSNYVAAHADPDTGDPVSASGWTLKRNAATTTSDLGQWGEVVRLFKDGETYKNAEEAGIVSVSDNKVTIAAVTANPSITDQISFAKVALNMQLNNGSNHGALCFASGGANKTALLSSSISVNGTIKLSGTGLLGFMRDGGNGTYLDTSNTFHNVNFFTGSISKAAGAETAEIELAVGETYGTYDGDSTGTGGKIYLSNNYGHDAQGLFAFSNGAEVTDLKVSGSINVERNAGSEYLYAGALFGAMTNGADLSGINITTTINATRSTEGKFYIGGVAGVFDGKEAPASGTHELTIDTSSSVKPAINLYGSISCDSDYAKNNSYVGGVLGLLKGSNAKDTPTKYGVSIESTEVSPAIDIKSGVSDANLSYLGGMIGRVAKNETNARSINIDTVTMTNASVDTKAKYAGGLLGAMWERTNLTVDGLTITGSSVNHEYSSSGSNQSGLVFMGTGKWDINSLSISNTSFSSTDTAPASFGLIVNQAYSGDDGLFINLINRGYTLATNVTVPTASSDANYYFDEIAADTSSGDILNGGKGTGVININMNVADGAKTKITDVSSNTENGTGTYQNRLYSQLTSTNNNLVANQNSRYYYNLDVMLAKGTKGSTAPAGEQFLLWSVYNYAAPNIRGYFKANGDMITGTSIDLSGLSYYPIPITDANNGVTLPTGSTVTFGFNAIKTYEGLSSTPDQWSRYPDDTGDPKSSSARNQHYLMQTGLFTTVTKLSATTLTLAGDFGYVSEVASGVLINKSTSGSVSLTGLTLDNLMPSSDNSYMLINIIDGTGTATPELTLSNLRAINYGTSGLIVAKSLFGTATGQNMTMNFSDIKLDARDGNDITDANWVQNASTYAEDMTDAYGTSRSIFKTAIFFTELWTAKTSNLIYNYAVEKDWTTTTTGPRDVTYGKEVTDSKQYENAEEHYYLEGETNGNYTNPISNSNSRFNFSAGFLPYVGNYTSKGTNTTYPVNEIKVNYKAPGLTIGCGTYNDPYIISSAAQLNTVAKTINGNSEGYPATIRLPNYFYKDHVSVSWHDTIKGCGIYNHSGTNYNKASDNTNGVSNGTWTETMVRYYLASAYYKIEGSWELPEDFEGIGVPNDTSNNYKGNTVFHGVIVGDSESKPTITNPTNNPLIYVANGAVVKNINIINTGTITREQTETGNSALYGYNGTNTDAKYYGGIIGEIMGGDNIIDDVNVTYSNSTITLGGSAKHLIAEGGMVGCVVNGALIFRGSNSVAGRTVTGGGIYSNPYVGRVINGYAIYEQIEDRTGTAPENGNNYHIDTIVRNDTKLDVNYTDSTIDVPDAQSLYILSLITQSIASTANTSDNENYNEYSPAYGYNGYVTGVARLGDYTDVGCGSTKIMADYTDYSKYAYRDSVNNYYTSGRDLVFSPTPYIIYRYTKAYVVDNNWTSKNYPARKMTSDNTKFWDITLSESETFESMDSFQAFRGIGSVGINPYSVTEQSKARTAFKIATFDGGNNTIKLHISLPRYERNKENYYHYQNLSLTQAYSGYDLHRANYGHDQNLWQLHGLGLFDCVVVKNDSSHEYQFKDFCLQGIIEDKVYNSSNEVTTGENEQTQLFCVGGVYGKRVTGNNSDVNFSNITFEGLSITGAYSCGGLVGIDAVKNATKMKIDGCNSTGNGISVIGGYYGKESNKLRHGIGSFVGMTFWCRPYIDGKTATEDTSDISVSSVSSFYEGNYMSSVGGLIGYSGSGAEIKNINLVAVNSNAVIGGEKTTFTAGFIGFTQAMTSDASSNRNTPNENDLKDCVYIENCTIQGLQIKAKNGVGGFVAKTGNDNEWHTKYIYISNCAVKGTSEENKSELIASGTGTTLQTNYAGGFVGDLRSSVVTCLIQNSYIENYKIEGWHVGGIIGETTYRSANLRNLYVKNCEIVRSNSSSGSMGGIVGYSNQNLNGYNLKIDNVVFKKKSGSVYNDSPSDAGFILGESNGAKVNKFIAIGAYNTTASKVPADVIKTSGTNSGNFFVFADYLNASATDVTNKTGCASTFGVTASNRVDQPLAPYVNVAPHMALGTDVYITGDGAGIGMTLGNAGEIYKDYIAGTSNRRYIVRSAAVTDSSVGNVTDAVTLAKYINNDGTYKNGEFRISTASAEFPAFADLTGVDDFAMLVINNDSEKADDITPFIKAYIRLVTNAAGSSNGLTNNQYAYSCGSTASGSNIDALYKIVITPCYYSAAANKFVLGTAGNQGLQLYSSGSNLGKYYLDSTKADSEASNTCQFSLIDVQFKDPTDTTGTKIAYHLYVPVYTKKMLTVNFSAVTMSGTSYYRSPYASKITSEIAGGKNATGNNSILVESTNEWTTTFIRYAYPKNQISSGYNWNFDKSITLYLDGNFNTLPAGTRLILVDPNTNVDKFYMLTLDGTYSTGTNITLDLSSFVDISGTTYFTPQNLSAIRTDSGNSDTEVYEDYYISMYVPKVEGQTHSVQFSSNGITQMIHTSEGETYKVNVDPKLYSLVVLGDLFDHHITTNSFEVNSGDGETWDDNREMTPAHKVLKTEVTATVQIKNQSAGAYLTNSDVYHAFFLTLTSYYSDNNPSDIINGITPGYITNTTTVSSSKSGTSTITKTESDLGANYVQLDSGSIKEMLVDPMSRPIVTISSVTTMTFNDHTAFPYNPNGVERIGTQVSVKSSLAYEYDNLLFSALNVNEMDRDGKFYYSSDKNDAELSFNAAPADDLTDEIGLKTNNKSLLGVNGKYGTSHPLLGKIVYNVDDIVNYSSANAVQYTITLYKKETSGNSTRYVKVNNISRYLSNVNLTDAEVTFTADRTTDPGEYIFTGTLNHNDPLDLDRMFNVTFSCDVLTGDAAHNEYANYKIKLTANLIGSSNALKDAYLIYTNAKFDPSVIPENE